MKNGVWGIAQEQSTRGVFRDNTARDNGDAGIFLANTVKEEAGATDTEGTVVEHNRLEGNRIGVTVRRVRNLHRRGQPPHRQLRRRVRRRRREQAEGRRADRPRQHASSENNKSCPKTARLAALQGSGIVLTGAEDTLVTRNVITGQRRHVPAVGRHRPVQELRGRDQRPATGSATTVLRGQQPGGPGQPGHRQGQHLRRQHLPGVRSPPGLC